MPTESEMPPSEPFEGFHKTGSEDIPRLVKMIKGKFRFDIEGEREKKFTRHFAFYRKSDQS